MLDAPKFPQNLGFSTQNFVLLAENILTRINFPDTLKFRGRVDAFLAPPLP